MSKLKLIGSSIEQLSEEYIDYRYFLDLIMLQTDVCFKEIAAFLLNKGFNQSIDAYSIDMAYRVKKLENQQFLDKMLEDILNDFRFSYMHRSNNRRLPRGIIQGDYEDCFLRKADILEIPYIKELGIALAGEKFYNDVAEILENRKKDQREYYEIEETCPCLKKIHAQDTLNLDEISCMICEFCYCSINTIKHSTELGGMFDDFWRYRNFLQAELESGNLVSNTDDDLFSNDYIKHYLYKNGFIIQGHNHGLDIPAILPPNHNIKLLSTDELKINSNQLAEAKAKIEDLESKLEQAITEKAADNKELTPKDSAYCLIAVLKNLLLDPNINAYHFKTDDTKSTNQPTQDGLASYIDDMQIPSILGDNVKILFGDANKKLKDANSKARNKQTK